VHTRVKGWACGVPHGAGSGAAQACRLRKAFQTGGVRCAVRRFDRVAWFIVDDEAEYATGSEGREV